MVHKKRIHQEPASRMESKGLIKSSSRARIDRNVFGRGSQEVYEGGVSTD